MLSAPTTRRSTQRDLRRTRATFASRQQSLSGFRRMRTRFPSAIFLVDGYRDCALCSVAVYDLFP